MSAAFVHLFNAEAAHPGTFGGAAPRPIDWGGIGGRILVGIRALSSRLLGALSFAAPTTMGDSSLVLSYRAPTVDQLATDVSTGFTGHTGLGLFLTLDPSVAAHWAQIRETGVFVFATPGSTYSSLVQSGGIVPDPDPMPLS